MPTNDPTLPTALEPVITFDLGPVNSNGGTTPDGRLIELTFDGIVTIVASPETMADLAAHLTGAVTSHYAQAARP